MSSHNNHLSPFNNHPSAYNNHPSSWNNLPYDLNNPLSACDNVPSAHNNPPSACNNAQSAHNNHQLSSFNNLWYSLFQQPLAVDHILGEVVVSECVQRAGGGSTLVWRLSATMSMGCCALAQFWGLLKMPEVALGSRRPSPTTHPVLYVSCNCLACSSLGAFQPRAGLAKRWALASTGRWACALLQRASAGADTSFSFFFGSVVEYCAAQQKLKAWLWGTK